MPALLPATLPPRNPNYGDKVFQRSVRLINRQNETIGELADEVHHIRCRIRHDGTIITWVGAEMLRLPMNTCPSASSQLQALVGTPINVPITFHYGSGKPRLNCTHLYDLAWWMITHARRQERIRQYDCLIPDHHAKSPYRATLLCNDAPLFEWDMSGLQIMGPEPFSGRNILKGFVRWAIETLNDEMLEGALILQKAYFVAQSRKFDRISMLGPVMGRPGMLEGVCWSYNSPQLERAIRIDSNIEFSPDERPLRHLGHDEREF